MTSRIMSRYRESSIDIAILSSNNIFSSCEYALVAATSFPGFSPTRPTVRVGENPGNEVVVAVKRDIYPKAPLTEIAWVRLTLF